MFNWFKSKVTLKNENCIINSVSNLKGVKLGTEITVPNNFKCLIYYNCKYYLLLDSGEHKIDDVNFAPIINHQKNTKHKLKRVKFISHFVNMALQKIEFKLKNQKYIVEFCIDEPLKFTELMTLYSFKIDNDYAYTYLVEIFSEVLLFNNKDCKQITANALSDYGITIKNFSADGKKVSILTSNKTVNEQKSNTKTIIEPNDELIISKQETKTDNTNNNDGSNISKAEDIVASLPKCPKCSCPLKFKTTYCIKCGFKLE